MAGNEVAEKKSTAVGTYDYGEYAHAGFEGTTVNDLSIPFINVLQSNSPEVEEQTIENAKAGDLLNSVTREILKQPVAVIPIFKESAVVEWIPRNKGGGIAGRYDLEHPEYLEAIEKNGGSRIPPKDSEGKRIPFKSKAGNDFIETYYMYCLIIDEETMETEGYCVLSFSSTKIKVYRDWLTAMFSQKGSPPLFANRCHISTVRQKNDSGTFFNYKISPMRETWRESLIPPNGPEGSLLKEAKDMADMISKGLARAAFDSLDDSGESSSDSSNRNNGDDDIPF